MNADTSSSSPTLTATNVPPGIYFVRVRARNASGVGGPSNEVLVIVQADCAGAPGPPTALTATVSGAAVTLSWQAPGGGCAATSYVIEAGSTPGSTNLAVLSTGNSGTTFGASGVPNGTYYVRIRSANGAGTSGPSNEALFSISVGPCGGPPTAPSGFAAGVAGTTVVLTWTAASGSPTSYVIEAGSGPGLSDLVVSDTGSLATSLTATAAPGTYYVRIRAKNACGIGPASPDVIVVLGRLTPLGPPTYSSGAARSTVGFSPPPPVPNAFHQIPDYQFTLWNSRAFAVGDFNGDGLNDLVTAPTWFNWEPKLPIQIWINQGGGRFANQTSAIIDGAVPVTGSVNNLFVADFNGDGRPDLFIVDQGLEDKNANNPGFDGAMNVVLLSQPNGKLKDVTASALPDNLPSFNHVSSMADINGDGFLDIVLTRLGGPKMVGEGTLFLINDGTGRFTSTTRGLPSEIAYPERGVSPAVDLQRSGSNGAFDLDGDGRVDLVTGSYNGPDSSGKRTLRFYQQLADGSFSERTRIEIPAALAGIGYFSETIGPDGLGLGVARITGADLNGDGRTDVIVLWEGGNKSYIEILRNEGAFRFSDVTPEWFGSYNATVRNTSNGFQIPWGGFELRDVNGDGYIDILPTFQSPGAYTADMLWSGGFAFLNDGTGHFRRLAYRTANTSSTVDDLIRAVGCNYCGYRPLLFDATGDGQADLVLLDPVTLHTPDKPYREQTVILNMFTGQYAR